MAFERKKYFFCKNGFLLIELILAFALLVTMSTVLVMSMMHAVYNQQLYVQQQRALLYAHNTLAMWLVRGHTNYRVPPPFICATRELPLEKGFSFLEVTITWPNRAGAQQKLVITGGGMR